MDRTYVFERREDEFGNDLGVDRQALLEVAADLIGTLDKVGGVVALIAQREHVATTRDGLELWRTGRIVAQWNSYAPGDRPLEQPRRTHRDDEEPRPQLAEDLADETAEPEAEPVASEA